MDFLASIGRARLQAVRRAASRVPARVLRDEAEARRGDRRPFAETIRRGGTRSLSVIAELKRASPSAGQLRPTFDPHGLARDYADGGAAALSVLTEPSHFRGSIEDLRAARDAVTLPILVKDFVVDEWQVFEARAGGADAALLIVALLSAAQLRDLAATARGIGLEILVEVHDEHETERALELDAMVGINNRDLRSLEIRPGWAERILPLIPGDRVRVAESGYGTVGALRALERAGADAALIGEHLMRSDSPGASLRALLEGLIQGDTDGPT